MNFSLRTNNNLVQMFGVNSLGELNPVTGASGTNSVQMELAPWVSEPANGFYLLRALPDGPPFLVIW